MQKPTASRTTITMAERIKVTDFIRSDYVTSGLADGPFGDLVKRTLDITVRRNHISAIREALEIPNNFARKTHPDDLATQVKTLQQQVADLTQRLVQVECIVAQLR